MNNPKNNLVLRRIQYDRPIPECIETYTQESFEINKDDDI